MSVNVKVDILNLLTKIFHYQFALLTTVCGLILLLVYVQSMQLYIYALDTILFDLFVCIVSERHFAKHHYVNLNAD
jgi:hypothetical protein